MKALGLTAFALTAFAFNSILCRLALRLEVIDWASFTSFRLLSGALAMSALVFFSKGRSENKSGGNWISAFFLFAYAVCFSFAYNGLTTATGALLLFGFVQLTMFAVSIAKGDRPSILEWLGLGIALLGLVYLLLPGLESPPVVSSVFMAASGAAWGFYTLRGKGSENPLRDTAGNFLRTVPFTLVVSSVFLQGVKISGFGVLMAVLSGAIASGVGYAVWYAALKFHTAARAAVLQLSVPVIAALGGVVIVAEGISSRLPIAAALILGGILATIVTRK